MSDAIVTELQEGKWEVILHPGDAPMIITEADLWAEWGARQRNETSKIPDEKLKAIEAVNEWRVYG